MTMRVWKHMLLALALLAGSMNAAGDEGLVMARVKLPFEEAMLELQNAVRDHDYQLSRVQRVDIGLTASGFETDKYRVVFFGRPDEIRELSERWPHLVAYLPLKIAIFAEQDQTLLVGAKLAGFRGLAEDPELQAIFERWAKDFESILDQVAAAD